MRHEAGLRQVDLVARVGMPQLLVSKIEVGAPSCGRLDLSLGGFVARLEERLGAAG